MLHRAPLFAEVPGQALVAVARLLEEVHVESGTTFIARGALEDWLYVDRRRVRPRARRRSHPRGPRAGRRRRRARRPGAGAPRGVGHRGRSRRCCSASGGAPSRSCWRTGPRSPRAVIHTLARLLQAADHGDRRGGGVTDAAEPFGPSTRRSARRAGVRARAPHVVDRHPGQRHLPVHLRRRSAPGHLHRGGRGRGGVERRAARRPCAASRW